MPAIRLFLKQNKTQLAGGDSSSLGHLGDY
jgi:hypothetical protein